MKRASTSRELTCQRLAGRHSTDKRCDCRSGKVQPLAPGDGGQLCAFEAVGNARASTVFTLQSLCVAEHTRRASVRQGRSGGGEAGRSPIRSLQTLKFTAHRVLFKLFERTEYARIIPVNEDAETPEGKGGGQYHAYAQPCRRLTRTLVRKAHCAGAMHRCGLASSWSEADIAIQKSDGLQGTSTEGKTGRLWRNEGIIQDPTPAVRAIGP